jgi:hypothetical protein
MVLDRVLPLMAREAADGRVAPHGAPMHTADALASVWMAADGVPPAEHDDMLHASS